MRTMVVAAAALLVGLMLPVGVVATPAGAGGPVGTPVDLGIGYFTDSPDPVVQGGSVTYETVVTNLLEGEAVSSALVQVQLPPEVSFSSYIASDGGTCTDLGGGLIDCDIPLAVSGSCATYACNYLSFSVTANAVASPASATIAVAPGAGYVEADGTNDYSNWITAIFGETGGDTETTTITGAGDPDLQTTAWEEYDPVGTSSVATWWAQVYNASATPAPDTQVEFALPAGMSFVASVGDGSCAELIVGTVTCDLGAVGGYGYAYPAVQLVTPATPGTIDVTATASHSGTEANPADDAATVTTDVVAAESNLHLTMVPAAYTVGEGQPIHYRIEVDNCSWGCTWPTLASDVQVVDQLPPGVTFVSASPSQGTCGHVAGVVTCDLGDLSAYAPPATIDLFATAPAGVSGFLTNEAEVTTSSPESELSDNVATVDVQITTPAADLFVSTSDDADPVEVGADISYWVQVHNFGPAAAPAVSLTDTLPAGSTLLSADVYWETVDSGACLESAGVVTCDMGTIDAGTYNWVHVVVTAPGAPGTVTNSATATTAIETNPTDNSDSETTTVVADEVDLQTDLWDSADPVMVDGALTYSAWVYNAGPVGATDVVYELELPAGAAFVSASPGQGSCAHAAGIVTCELGALAAYSSVYVDVAVTAPSTPQLSSATSTVSSPQGDWSPGNESDTETTQILADGTDLWLDTWDTADPVAAGDPVGYWIQVSNNGPFDAHDVVVTDTLPAGSSFVSADVWYGADTCVEVAGTLTCDLGTLAAYSTEYVAVEVDTAPGVATTYTNTASVTSSTPEAYPPDNTDSEDTTIEYDQADLLVQLSDEHDPAAAGQPLHYTAYVHNDGVSDAPDTTLTLELPAGSTFVSATPDQGSCAEAAGTVTCDLATVGAYTWLYVDLEVVSPGAPTTATLDASVSSSKVDPDPSDNSDTEDTTVLAHQTDLSVWSFGDSLDPVEAGGAFYYTFWAYNNGPVAAHGTELVLDLPAGASFVSASATSGSSCAETAGVVTCDVGVVPAGSWAWAQVELTAPLVPGTITASAAVSSDAVELTPGDNTDTEDTEVVVDEADLSVSLWDSVDPAATGDQVTYTVAAHNAGPMTAPNTVVTDTLPAGSTYVSSSPTQGTCGHAAGVVTCNLGTLAAYATAYIDITVTMPPSTGTVSNSASITSDRTDPDLSDNSASEDTEVVPDEADLRIEVSDTVDPVPTGDAFSYVLAVHNDSQATTSDVVVTDTLPAGTTFVSASAGCLHAAGVVTCTVGSLGGYGWTYVVIDVTAPGTAAALTNQASVTSSRPDPDPSDNSDTEYTTVGEAQADLVIEKAGPTLALVGGELSYSIWATNTGLFPADDVVVTDTLPAGSTFVSADPGCSHAAGVVTCDVGDLAVGSWDHIWITIDAPATGGDITNSATVSASTPDNDLTDNTATAGTQVIDLVANAGDDQAVVTGQTVSFDGGGSSPLADIDSFSWDFGDSSGGGGQTTTHSYAAPGTYTVTLTVNADGETDSDTATVTVTDPPATTGLEVTVEDTGATPLPGADVLVIDGDGVKYSDVTDGSGIANLDTLPDGTYTVYAYKPGYLPNLVSGAVVSGGAGSATVVLEAGQLATTSLTSEPLTYEEILAAGIDPSDPENQHVYEFEIGLAFQTGTTTISGYLNQGGFVGDGGTCTEEPCAFALGGAEVTVGSYWVEEQPILTFMVIPGSAKFLKEFFSVQFQVTNLALPAFTLTGGSAELPLPPGLALAPTATPQSSVVAMPDIPGGSSATAEWIVRGDEEGFYDLSATYTGTLQPFGAPVVLHGQTATPLHVWAGSALEMIVDVEDQAYDGFPYRVRIGLHNVADVPVYNPAVELLPGCVECVYAPEQTLERSSDVVEPGDTFWTGDFVVIPNLTGPLDLSASFVRKTGGDVDLGGTITSHPPLQTPGTAPVITATPATGGVQLDWDPIPGVTGYLVFTAPDRVSDFTGPVASVPSSQTDAFVAAPPGTLYYAVVPERDAGGAVDMRHPVVAGSPSTGVTGPVVSVGDSSIVEGNTGKVRTMQVPVVLSEPASGPVVISYRIVSGSASGGNVDIGDFGGATRTLKLNPSTKTGFTPTYKTINVKVTPDLLAEGDETFTVEILGVTGADLGRAVGTGTVVDDEGVLGPTVAISPVVTTVEGDSGAQKIQFRVTLSDPVPVGSTYSVQLDTTGGTLTPVGEYKPLRANVTKPFKTLTFKEGQWQKTVTVTLYPDAVAEADETLHIDLFNPAGGVTVFGSGVAIGTVLDDD